LLYALPEALHHLHHRVRILFRQHTAAGKAIHLRMVAKGRAREDLKIRPHHAGEIAVGT
jgi:hypothetical protein